MTEIKMKEVESSLVSKIGFDPINDTLAVEFKKGQIYHYLNVPVEVWDRLQEAESTGKFLIAEVYPRYKFKQITK